GIVQNLEAPVLVLKDDGHFIGVAFLQEGRNVNAFSLCLEGQVKVMAANEPLLFHPLERCLNHAAEGLVGKRLITDVVLGHEIDASRNLELETTDRFETNERVGSFCCPVLPEPRLLMF